MQITEIKKIGKGDRYSIFIDDIFNGTLETEILVKEKLKTGDEISEERLKQIKLDNGKLAAFSRAISYIEKGLHTEKQLRAYLKEKGFLPESIDEAIEKLLEYGYIDDVIEPRNTRFRIIRALQQLQTKKLSNPAKKHDNLPL